VRRHLANPVVQFLAAGLVVLVVVVIGTVKLSREAADDEALKNARTTTKLLGESVAQPAMPRGLVGGKPAAVSQFNRRVLGKLLVGDVKRIKIWRRDGTIVYSDKSQLIGNHYSLGDDEAAVLKHGNTDAELSDLSEPENRYERNMGDLVEVYSRIRSPEGEPLLFEAYYSESGIAKQRQQIYDSFQPITLGGLVVLVALTTPLLWVLTRRLDRTRRDRQRLLEAAADASESERRRIARDLHDGVVQDLAGTSFALSATLRDPRTSPETAQRLAPMSQSLRTSLRALRSLLVEIYPPDLGTDGLNAALQDLVAPAAAAGVTPSVEVYDVDEASDESIRLVWRVAQEAVRNAIRHSNAEHLTVQVRTIDDLIHLDVSDDGDGFDSEDVMAARGTHSRAAGAATAEVAAGVGAGVGAGAAVTGAPTTSVTDRGSGSAGIGLRSLRDLIREAGGRLDVRSAAGEGTTVHLEVAR
jgi:two-component system NarL family sensor kinase